MPRGSALALTNEATLGLFFIQRYRFLTIDPDPEPSIRRPAI